MKYQIIVGNLGTVIDTDDLDQCMKEWEDWKKIVEFDLGRASGEEVTIMKHGEIKDTYFPANCVNRNEEGIGIMRKMIDHRPQWTNNPGKFRIEDVEAIETTGQEDGDYVIRLKNGDSHYYRCSCAITFEKGNEFLIIK